MKNLSDLLGKFARALDGDAGKREAVSDIIRENLGFDIDPKNISFDNEAVTITTTPARKNEIYMHQDKILLEIRERCRTNVSRVLYR
jgi:hypothetical protein